MCVTQCVPEAWQERKERSRAGRVRALSSLLQGHGVFFPDIFFKLGSREWLPLWIIPLVCKKGATVTNVAPYGKYKWSNLLLWKEEPSLSGRKVSCVLCGTWTPCFRAGRLFCCLHIVTNGKKIEYWPCNWQLWQVPKKQHLCQDPTPFMALTKGFLLLRLTLLSFLATTSKTDSQFCPGLLEGQVCFVLVLRAVNPQFPIRRN